MSWNRVSADRVAPTPWRNGGGQTRELLAWPRAEDWTLRISVADIGRDGPFSAFPGTDRWFAVLSGEGVRLLGRVLRPGDDALRFEGEAAPRCALLGGPTRDFNAMHRRGAGHFGLRPAAQPMPSCGLAWLGLFTEGGGRLRQGGQALPLAPRTLAWCAPPAAPDCSFDGGAAPGAAWWLFWSDT